MAPKRAKFDVAELRHTLEKTEDLLHRVQKQLGTCRRWVGNHQKFSRLLKTECRILMCRLHGNHEELLPFIRMKAAQHDATVTTEWVTQLRAWYVDSTAVLRNEFAAGTSSAFMRKAASAVDKYMREHKLCEWVEVQNERLGIVPAPSLVVGRLGEFDLRGRSNANPRRLHKHSLQFLSRWRRRWKVTLAKNRPMDACTPEEVTDKVGKFRGPKACP